MGWWVWKRPETPGEGLSPTPLLRQARSSSLGTTGRNRGPRDFRGLRAPSNCQNQVSASGSYYLVCNNTYSSYAGLACILVRTKVDISF